MPLFVGTGRAPSAAAGRLSYVYGLKVSHWAYRNLHRYNAREVPIFAGTSRALSAAAGRVSYVYGLKVSHLAL